MLHPELDNGTQKEVHFCQFCCEATNSIKNLVDHCTEHHEGQPLPYFLCTECNFHDKKLFVMKSHLQNEHGIDTYKPYHCKHCDRKDDSIHHYYNHVKTHSDAKNYICEICSKPLKNKDSIRMHKTIFHEKQEIVCDICGYKASNKEYLLRHVKRVHNKSYECQYCGQRYGVRENLEIHIDVKHPEREEKKYFCESCEKSFIFRNSMVSHKHNHHLKGVKKGNKKKMGFTKEKSKDIETLIKITKNLDTFAKKTEEGNIVYECPACKSVLSTRKSKLFSHPSWAGLPDSYAATVLDLQLGDCDFLIYRTILTQFLRSYMRRNFSSCRFADICVRIVA